MLITGHQLPFLATLNSRPTSTSQQLMSFQSTPGTAGAGTDRNKQKQTCEHSAHVRGLIPCQLHPTAMTRFPVVQCDSQVITARLQRFGSETLTIPIGSMYAIYGNIYHQYTPNVSINTSTMDSYGIAYVGLCRPNVSGLHPHGATQSVASPEAVHDTCLWSDPCSPATRASK